MYIYARCPRCRGRVDFFKQLAEYQATEEDKEVIAGSLVGSMRCDHCNDYTLVLALHSMDETLLPESDEARHNIRSASK